MGRDFNCCNKTKKKLTDPMAILHRPLGVTGPYTGFGGIIDLVKSLNGFNVDMGDYYNHLF